MQLYLAAAPCCLGNAARWGLPLLHAAYSVEESRLTSLTLPAHVQGGLLLLTGPENPAVPQPDTLARDILRECLRRRYTGVVIEPQLPAAALSALAELCRRYGRALYVAEPCGHMVPDARVVVSTALSGGTLRQRLRDACRRFEARRLALDLACVRMDFSLPAPYGTGTALTPQQLTELRGQPHRILLAGAVRPLLHLRTERHDPLRTVRRCRHPAPQDSAGRGAGHPCWLSGPAGSDGGAAAAAGQRIRARGNHPRALSGSIITLIAVLARSLGLLTALDTGAFIALSLTHLGQNACLGAASLETLQSAVQGLAFLDVNFRHLYFPPSDAPGSILGAL